MMKRNSNFPELTLIKNCLACNSTSLLDALDLDNQPLANEYLRVAVNRTEYPLKLRVCMSCFHSQLSHEVSPEKLFSDYPYVSSTSTTMRSYFEILRTEIETFFPKGGKILDIGSNDGTFLSTFSPSIWHRLGIDPAQNLTGESREKGITTIAERFTWRLSQLLATFDVITAINVFAHTAQPDEMLDSILQVSNDKTLVLIQTSQCDMLIDGQFDTIYHEHISFFNVRSMKALLRRKNLYLFDLKIVSVHGNSYLWYVSTVARPESESLRLREIFEEDSGVYSNHTYQTLTDRSSSQLIRFRDIVNDFKAKKYKIVAYGSAAKGNTFLGASKIYPERIFDDTPNKIGRYSPLGNLLIEHPSELFSSPGKFLVIVPAWNFRDEICKKLNEEMLSEDSYVLTYYPTLKIDKIK